MGVLSWLALGTGALAGLRAAAGWFALVRYLRGARVSAIGPEPTPPLSVLLSVDGHEHGLEANVESLLRQNYPQFEVVVRADGGLPESVRSAAGRVADVEVRAVEEPRHERRVETCGRVRADPLFLRDAAHGLARARRVVFPPVWFGARGARARLLALAGATDALWTLLLAAACARTWRPARRAVRLFLPAAGPPAGLAWARRARAAAPAAYAAALAASAAPVLLALVEAWWALAALAGLQVLAAVVVDLRFAWDRSLLRSLPLLPLLWLVEPLVLLAGCTGRADPGTGGARATLHESK